MSDQAIQRKLAAILYADVAGYSRLTGQDKDASHEALRAGLGALTRAIEGRGGKVNHYAGDGILAEFGSVDDMGDSQVKNVSAPVRTYRVVQELAASDLNAEANVDVTAPVSGFEGRPAIAVLPFDNLSGDPEQEFFADGLTEDIITRLSYWRYPFREGTDFDHFAEGLRRAGLPEK